MKIINFLLVLMVFMMPMLAEEKDDEDDIAKMVYHCDFNDDARFSAMLDNIRFSADYYNDNMMEYDIRVVANSGCIRYMFKKTNNKNFLPPSTALRKKLKSRALNYDIGLYVCENTINALKLNKKNLEPYIKIVTSGVVEVVRLQQKENFGYLKVK